VDLFALVILGGVAVLFLAFYALGRLYPGSGAEQLDWRPTRSPELEAANELDDLDQMREALNARRRARGERELTEQDFHDRVAEDRALTRALRRSSR
jgi:hypothetical protein